MTLRRLLARGVARLPGFWGGITFCGVGLTDGVVTSVAVAIGIAVADAVTITVVGRCLEGRSVGRRSVAGLEGKGKAED